jgi:hypothetical protein
MGLIVIIRRRLFIGILRHTSHPDFRAGFTSRLLSAFVRFSGRTVARIHLLPVRFGSRFITRRCRKLAGFPGMGKTVLAFALALQFAAARSWAVSWLSFWGPLPWWSSIVAMVEHWRARGVDSPCHTSSTNSNLNVCTTRAAPTSALSLSSLHSSKHYSLLPIARHVAPTASIGDLEMGKSDLRIASLVILSLTSLLQHPRAAPCRPFRSPASPNNSGGTIAA